MTSAGHNEINNIQSPTLNGLVLAGGKSTRMGRDKPTMQWHGQEQRFHVAGLLMHYCSEVFISCRDEQQFLPHKNYGIIADAYEGLGPYGAILSAFKKNDRCAWLVIACDLPLLDQKTIAHLVDERDPAFIATTFESPHDGLPEPLVTIWEPSSYPILLKFLSKGIQCPRKALINNRVKIIRAENSVALMNVNTPGEFENAQAILNNIKISERQF
jgi:molybdopterin-guanine dinucleotide biosynthesis protein A